MGEVVLTDIVIEAEECTRELCNRTLSTMLLFVGASEI